MKLRSKSTFLILAVVALLGHLAKADPQSKLTASVTRVPGQPVQFKLNDGRVAEVFVVHQKAISVDFDFKIDRDSCSSEVSEATVCSLKSDILRSYFAYRWITHPTDVGKIPTSNGSTYSFTGQFAFFSQDLQVFPENSIPVKPLRLICNDYGWISKGLGKNAPDKFEVAAWAPQTQGKNPQTNVEENALTALFTDVVFKKDASGEMVLRKARTSYRHDEMMMPISLQGYQVSQNLLIFQDGGQCKIHLVGKSSDSYKAVFANLDFDPRKVKSEDFEKYVYGQDPFIDLEIDERLFTQNGLLGYAIKFPEEIK